MKGRKIILTPKTHKGKNRVKENGNIWIVIREGILLKNIMLDIPGDNDQMLICPINNELNLRWIKKENDQDFEWSNFEG